MSFYSQKLHVFWSHVLLVLGMLKESITGVMTFFFSLYNQTVFAIYWRFWVLFNLSVFSRDKSCYWKVEILEEASFLNVCSRSCFCFPSSLRCILWHRGIFLMLAAILRKQMCIKSYLTVVTSEEKMYHILKSILIFRRLLPLARLYLSIISNLSVVGIWIVTGWRDR